MLSPDNMERRRKGSLAFLAGATALFFIPQTHGIITQSIGVASLYPAVLNIGGMIFATGQIQDC